MKFRKFQFISKEAENILLSVPEKSEMRGNLVAFMRTHPPVSVQPSSRHIWSGSSRFRFANFILRPMPIALVLLLLFGTGTGISFAAEQALPGDVLYPVKVGVTEEIRGAFTFSAHAGAQWEAKRVERRLEEAEELAKQGRLTEDIRAQIESNFDMHAERINERLSQIEARGEAAIAAEVTSDFEASLKAHEGILERFAEGRERGSGDDNEAEELLLAIKIHRLDIEDKRADTEDSLVVETHTVAQAAAEERLREAQERIQETQNRLDESAGTLNAEAKADAEMKLTAAKAALAEGKTRLEAGQYGQAFVSFQEAHRLAQEANVSLRATGNLDIYNEGNEGEQSEGSTEDEKQNSGTEPQDEEDNEDDEGSGGGGDDKEDLLRINLGIQPPANL